MAYDLQVSKTFNVGGKTYQHTETIPSDAAELLEALIPIAQAGVLTVRMDTNTGSLTMTNVSHGITTASKIDLYWAGGQRRYMTVGTVAGAVVPIDLGSGTDLPVAATAIIAAMAQVFTVSIAGSNILSLIATADLARCQITLNSVGPVEELWINLDPASNVSKVYDWLSTGTATNPIVGDAITEIHITIADTVTARNARVATQIDA